MTRVNLISSPTATMDTHSSSINQSRRLEIRQTVQQARKLATPQRVAMILTLSGASKEEDKVHLNPQGVELRVSKTR